MPHGPAVKATPTHQNPSNAEGSGRRRGRPKVASDAVQRAAVVAAAHHLFVSDGYGGTTMDTVAARCRMSKRTLYRLFPGKADLFAAVVEAHRQTMLALPGDYDHLPLDAALAAIFRIDISDEEELERRGLFRLVMVERHAFPELDRMLIHHGAERAHAELTRWLAARAAQGEIVLDEPAAMARLLMDMVLGGQRPRPGDWPAPPPEGGDPPPPSPPAPGDDRWPDIDGAARRAHVRRCIGLFLNGVVPR